MPQISCRPRPTCLDSNPKCLIPSTSDMCPKAESSAEPLGEPSGKPSVEPSPPSDVQFESKVTIYQLPGFIGRWIRKEPTTDLNHDNQINFGDISSFFSLLRR